MGWQCMHDEDSLHARNPLGESWVVYGNSRLLEDANKQNLKEYYAALTVSTNEVFEAWSKG